MRKKSLWCVFGFGLYLLLLRLLVYAESFAADASIVNLGDALWFSLVTLTTAGYGDCFPVTLAGRVIGAFFLLCSTGLIALLIGMTISLAGRILPWLRLRVMRRHPWYVFIRRNKESAALAANLSQEQPDAVIVYCRQPGSEDKEGVSLPPGLRTYQVEGSPADVLRGRGEIKGCTFLVMGADSWPNYTQSQSIVSAGAPVCCQSDVAPESLPENLTLFDQWDCCARLYWQQYPLAAKEQSVVLIGCGRYGAALLERALLCNVYGPDRAVTYYVFGDSSAFLRCHSRLGEVMPVTIFDAADLEADFGTGQGRERRDRLIFCQESWESAPHLLEQAERLILCTDSDEENVRILTSIRRYFPTGDRLHIRLDGKLEGAEVFGTDAEIFTPALVLRTRLSRLAMEMHEIYRRSSGGKAPVWGQLGDFPRRSNLAAADHLLTKIRILLADDSITEVTAANCREAYSRYLESREEKAAFYREIEHDRWWRFHAMNNWKYGEKRDNLRRCHPDMRPFDQLSLAEQAKDDYAWELLGALAEGMEE